MPVVGRAAAVAATKQTRRRPRRSDAHDGDAEGSTRKLKRSKTKRYLYENVGCYGNKRHDQVVKVFAKLRDAKWFQTSIIGVIFLAGILVGIQTYPLSNQTLISVLEDLDMAVLVIFIAEIVIKLVAEGNRPFDFFKNAWNVFDFLIVVVGLMPFGGNAVTALRLVRLLRVLKLVRALPKLRILVMGLLKSLSSIAYIGLLLGLLFYLYAVLGVSVFGENDPVHMGTLHISFLTLFRCATLEDWTDVMYIAMEGCENYGYDGMEDECTKSTKAPILSVAYFCSFIILSSMMILNLFIGVITSSMQDAKTELTADMEEENDEEPDEDVVLIKRLAELEETMLDVADEMNHLVALDKERNQSALVQLSRKSVLRNTEIEKSRTTTPTASATPSATPSPSPPSSPHQRPPIAVEVEAKDGFSNLPGLETTDRR